MWNSFNRIILLSVLVINIASSQISTVPARPKPNESVTIIFDASKGNAELKSASQIYMHHGVVTDKIDGTAWKYVKGNWGKDDGIGKMTKVPGSTDKWQITLQPTLKSYFGVPDGENIFRISAVFRNADGSIKGTSSPGNYSWGTITSNLDYYIDVFNENTININLPTSKELTINSGEVINFGATASGNATSLKLFLNEGNGYEEKVSLQNSNNIQFAYKPNQCVTARVKVEAYFQGLLSVHEREFFITVKRPNNIIAIPNGLVQGINYDSNPTKATLVLFAPEKQFVHVVGDFNSWSLNDRYQMNQSPDKNYFWLEIENLIPGKPYVFQYWIDGKIKVGDPYANQVADPWNDKWIESSVFPNTPDYTNTDFGIATVLQTAQTSYNWQPTESSYQRPDINHLVIYELHLRDFIHAHSFDVLKDTLSYFKKLGVNAIELMPINEFEGNDSWGYNPSYYFAVDKYYGHKDALKKFIEHAHALGIAVIMDLVLNHSYGESPMVKMYFDDVANKPTSNNPWYNREYIGPYQWGYDFNHESVHTQRFVEEVCKFWLKEFHFDGFRLDFTKGFTNYAPNNNIDGYDASRIAILKRINNKIKAVDPKAYVILEHWAPSSEEQVLADEGMKMWRNKTYDFIQSTIGNTNSSFEGSSDKTHITLYGSHDEQRVGYHCLTEGYKNGSYDIKNKSLMLERIKMMSAFYLMQPGPKMIWQFDELGYDIDINFNGRIGRKPYVWGSGSLQYYNDQERQYVFKVYSGLLHIRNTITPSKLANATTKHKLTGPTRRLAYDTDDIDVLVYGNVDTKANTLDISWIKTGWWYDYFSGDSVNVSNIFDVRELAPGEWHIYTSKKLGNGEPNAVSIYENPVTINPSPFKSNQNITIRFEAKKSDPNGTLGLVNATKVYMHAGVKYTETMDNQANDIIRTYPNFGAMTEVSPNIWEIKITPDQYFDVPVGKTIRELNMWFRDESGNKLGYGFRGAIISYPILSDAPIITVDPPSFKSNTEIILTFDAAQGNRELVGANKVYMHSGIGIINTLDPTTSAWNNVKGNWGKDDGVGLMTKVVGTEKWQIKLTPSQYYGINSQDIPYWIAAVFRNEDGSKKGTTNPGPMSNGIVASNLDYFIRQTENLQGTSISVVPNPMSSQCVLRGFSHGDILEIFNSDGKNILSQMATSSEIVVDSDLWSPGIYFFTVSRPNLSSLVKGKIIKVE